MRNAYIYQTQIGKMIIAEDGVGITELYVADKSMIDHGETKETPLLRKAAQQIEEYLSGKRKEFELPLHPTGSEFQKKVWDALIRIPYGEKWSYKKVAESINKPTAARAVGMANHKNPILIVVPCHRVIGASGKLVGYAAGLELKEKLLVMEKEAGWRR